MTILFFVLQYKQEDLTMLKFEPFYQEYERTLDAFSLAFSTIYFEQMTIAPKKGIPYSNEMLSRLSKQAFIIENDPETIQKIKEYAKTLPEGSLEKKEVDYRLEALAQSENIPSDVYANYVKVKADSELAWHEAKEADNYEHFKPHLQAIMKETLHLLEYDPKFNGNNAYDVLLDRYEKGMTQEKYDAFFNNVKEKLVPLIHEIQNKPQINDDLLHETYDLDRQEKFMEVICDFMKVDFGKVYLSTTEHPFTDFFSSNDARITTHYYPDQFLSAILSTVHEYGHALYGLQMDPAFEGTMLTQAVGSAAHESQSRFLENHVGRSHAFWQANYNQLVNLFPEFKDVSVDELVNMINKTECALIRTEADELTYPLHIMVRYEIEKEIAKGNVDYDKLPELWADKYEEYLGVRPTNYKEGVLQDMHWSTGYLGYFPTYALGSAYAAQLYATMEKQFDVKEALLTNHFEKITNWLKENVHHYAASKSMAEIVEEVSGEPFNPDYYTDYLIKKYKKLYNLD